MLQHYKHKFSFVLYLSIHKFVYLLSAYIYNRKMEHEIVNYRKKMWNNQKQTLENLNPLADLNIFFGWHNAKV